MIFMDVIMLERMNICTWASQIICRADAIWRLTAAGILNQGDLSHAICKCAN